MFRSAIDEQGATLRGTEHQAPTASANFQAEFTGPGAVEQASVAL